MCLDMYALGQESRTVGHEGIVASSMLNHPSFWVPNFDRPDELPTSGLALFGWWGFTRIHPYFPLTGAEILSALLNSC